MISLSFVKNTFVYILFRMRYKGVFFTCSAHTDIVSLKGGKTEWRKDVV